MSSFLRAACFYRKKRTNCFLWNAGLKTRLPKHVFDLLGNSYTQLGARHKTSCKQFLTNHALACAILDMPGACICALFSIKKTFYGQDHMCVVKCLRNFSRMFDKCARVDFSHVTCEKINCAKVVQEKILYLCYVKNLTS